MNKLTIFNTYVEMESQEQCDRMKQLCLDNGLPIWSSDIAFKFFKGDEIAKDKKYFESEKASKDFFVTAFKEQKNKVTEQQFINLLKEYKDGN